MIDKDLLRVTKIRVVGLFARYTHEVPLRTQERVTIIHGPNGVGKTVLLRLVAASFSGNLGELLKVPFETFEVALSDGAVLGFRHRPSTGAEDADEVFIASLTRDGSTVEQVELKASQVDLRRSASVIERELPWLFKMEEDRFLDQREDEIFNERRGRVPLRRHVRKDKDGQPLP